VVITPEDEGDDTIIFSGVTSSAGISSGGFISGGTSSAGITSGGFVSSDSLFGGSGEDVVTFDDPLD
jgi:hypothetical protein